MSLDGILRRRALHHSSLKCMRTISPHLAFCQRSIDKSLERCFMHRLPMLPSNCTGARLLSISLTKFSFLSRLTSYFASKPLKKEEPIKEDLNNTETSDYKKTANDKQTEDDPHHSSSWRSVIDTLTLISPPGFKKTEPIKEDSNNPRSIDYEKTACNKQAEGDLQHSNSLRSIIDKFTITSPPGWAISSSVAPQENQSSQDYLQKKLDFQKKIIKSSEEFLKQYNSDLDIILKKVTPLQPASKKSKLKQRKLNPEVKTEDKTSIFKNIKYPTLNPRNQTVVRTDRFEETKKYLQSLGIPVDELEIYPLIQEMGQEMIDRCVEKLKEKGIHVVFSLFLIERVAWELGICHKHSATTKKQLKKAPLLSLQLIQVYLELCHVLDKPDLDIRGLLEQLAHLGQFPDIYTLNRKVKKLRSVGATPGDILSNLEILQGYEMFDQKVGLYEKSPHAGQTPFPVDLFMAKNMPTFMEKLDIGDEVQKVAKLLDVTLTEFQTCWGFRYHINSKLLYKVHMCLTAGISKKDIFNNLGTLIAFPVDQCHAMTSSFRDSGLPASVFVLREMASAVKENGSDMGCSSSSTSSETGHNSKDVKSVHAIHEEDWTGDARTVGSDKLRMLQKIKKISTLRQNEVSTKKHRRMLFGFIQHLLKLDPLMVSAMYDCSTSVIETEMLDVSNNLDYLLSMNFTREQISLCPLVLAHRHGDVRRVVSDVENIILVQLQSASVISHSCGSSSSSSSLAYATVTELRLRDKQIYGKLLQNSPVMCLNTYQYLLEKEKSFSLAD